MDKDLSKLLIEAFELGIKQSHMSNDIKVKTKNYLLNKLKGITSLQDLELLEDFIQRDMDLVEYTKLFTLDYNKTDSRLRYIMARLKVDQATKHIVETCKNSTRLVRRDKLFWINAIDKYKQLRNGKAEN